jgi:hypothetical protein
LPHDPHAFDEEDVEGTGAAARRFDEFECPACAAHNPYGDGFTHGDEVRCFYCGQDFLARVSDGGRLRLEER